MDRLRDAELVYGVHPVGELLAARASEVERIWVARERGRALGSVLRRAREAGVPVTYLDRELLGRKLGRRAVHQGIVAQVAPIAYTEMARLKSAALEQPAAILALLDGVVDPQNLGAAIRSCSAAGAAGLVVGAERSPGLTPAVLKASAGTAARLPLGRAPRPGALMEDLRAEGFQAVGLDVRGEHDWDAVDLTGRIIIVAGSEERGLRPGLRKRCDQLVRIPLARGVESLNVAVALGVLLFEAVRQRRGHPGRP